MRNQISENRPLKFQKIFFSEYCLNGSFRLQTQNRVYTRLKIVQTEKRLENLISSQTVKNQITNNQSLQRFLNCY